MSTAVHESDNLSVTDAARMLAVAPITIRRKIASGQLPAAQLGGPGSALRSSDVFVPALGRARLDRARAYDLRHSFASVLLHEGRSVIYVARQLGHDARYTLGTYGHVMDKLEGQPRISAKDAICAARVGLGVESRSQSRWGV